MAMKSEHISYRITIPEIKYYTTLNEIFPSSKNRPLR